MPRFLLVCLICLISTFISAQKRSVALTFDDLPLALAGRSEKTTPAQTLAETKSVNKALLRALKRHYAPAVAFVNEIRVTADGYTNENRAILNEWIMQDQELGNHTYSHADLDKLTVDQFEKEIMDGEASMHSLLPSNDNPMRYFRFPFNHAGESREKHDAITAFLHQHGYTVAVCTVENSDWIFAQAYRLMLDQHNTQSAARLRIEYLEYTAKQIAYYAQLNTQVFGHEIPQVMLLHANRLNADTLEQILRIFENKRYKFVTLKEAQADPAYRTPDTFFTSAGPMWGYRWARELNVKVDGSKEPEVPAWVEEYRLKR